jgi:hypothetical protein
MKQFILLLTMSLVSLCGCTRYVNLTKKKVFLKKSTLCPIAIHDDTTRPIITIWIHGTQLSVKTLKTLYRVIAKPVQALGIKNLPNVHVEHGLHHVQNINNNNYIRKRLYTLSIASPCLYQFDHSYIFGWSGKLSFKERKKEAGILYNDLYMLIKSYKEKYDKQPYIRIITHSHGGNVALNLANEYIKDPHPSMAIDELILLACPVQKETAAYAASPLFKKIYSLYSHGDIIQILDPQGLHNKGKRFPLFSHRRFDYNPKIRQVFLTFNGRPMLHISFILSHFIKNLPAIIQEIDTWYEEVPTYKNEIRKLRIFT